jgi:hypothetical protein
MSNLFIDSYIESLPYKEKLAANNLIDSSMSHRGKTLDDLISLPPIPQVNLSKPKDEDIISTSLLQGNHKHVVRYLESSYVYAQEIGEIQKACDDSFDTTMANIESSLDQLRMELEAWPSNLSNRIDFSGTKSINFTPPLTISGAGEETLRITNVLFRSNTQLDVRELGPQYRFAVYSPTRVSTDILGVSTTGLQIELSLYVEPQQANLIKISPWVVKGSPAYIHKVLAYGQGGEPITVATGLVLNKEHYLTFPKSSIQKIGIQLYQENYSISTLPVSTPGLTDVEVLNKLSELLGDSYVNSLWKDRFIDWQKVEEYISTKFRLGGYTKSLISQRTKNYTTESNKSYHLYQIGLNNISIVNQYSGGEIKEHIVSVPLRKAPSQVTLRASDWIPDFTAVEYAVKTRASNSYIPVPNADETGYINEILYPGKNWICSLRFPSTKDNGRMPKLFDGTRQMETSEYELINDRQVRLTGTLSNNSSFSIRYEVKDKENIQIPYSSSISIFHGIDGSLGDSFEGTSENNSVSLSAEPYIDTTRLTQLYYSPIVVNIIGRSTEDITNWHGTKENEFARVPDKDNIQFKVRGQMIFFDQPVDQPITAIYEYLTSDIDIRIVERCFSSIPASPSVSNIQISYLERN